MPRKSAAELNVVAIEGRTNRLRPPANLPQPERDLFAQLVAASAATHFKLSDVPLLTQYVTAAVLADRAAEVLRVEPVVGGRPSPWLAVFEKANRAVVALSMRLRLSPQARSPNHPPGARKEPTPSAYDVMRLTNDDED